MVIIFAKKGQLQFSEGTLYPSLPSLHYYGIKIFYI